MNAPTYGRIFFSCVAQGFLRASLETRKKIAPSFFSRELNQGHGEKDMKTLLLLPLKILWFIIKLPFKILKAIFSGASVKSDGMFN